MSGVEDRLAEVREQLKFEAQFASNHRGEVGSTFFQTVSEAVSQIDVLLSRIPKWEAVAEEARRIPCYDFLSEEYEAYKDCGSCAGCDLRTALAALGATQEGRGT